MRSDLLAEMAHATVLVITSHLRDDISMRIRLEPSSENGLRTASQAMVDWPQRVRLSVMGEAIGRLNLATMRSFTQQLAVMLGIGSGTDRVCRPRADKYALY
jgi:mRNA-degrading endonuclease toxin of MazEF toxin-antitoxin module